MTPTSFPEADRLFGAPDGLTESQVGTLRACVTKIQRGSLEGAPVIVTAWRPTAEELARLNAGGAIYLSIIGAGLPPHTLTTTFAEAVAPA